MGPCGSLQVGQIPIGDATGGAVKHVGGDFNYTARDAWQSRKRLRQFWDFKQ